MIATAIVAFVLGTITGVVVMSLCIISGQEEETSILREEQLQMEKKLNS